MIDDALHRYQELGRLLAEDALAEGIRVSVTVTRTAYDPMTAGPVPVLFKRQAAIAAALAKTREPGFSPKGVEFTTEVGGWRVYLVKELSRGKPVWTPVYAEVLG